MGIISNVFSNVAHDLINIKPIKKGVSDLVEAKSLKLEDVRTCVTKIFNTAGKNEALAKCDSVVEKLASNKSLEATCKTLNGKLQEKAPNISALLDVYLGPTEDHLLVDQPEPLSLVDGSSPLDAIVDKIESGEIDLNVLKGECDQILNLVRTTTSDPLDGLIDATDDASSLRDAVKSIASTAEPIVNSLWGVLSDEEILKEVDCETA